MSSRRALLVVDANDELAAMVAKVAESTEWDAEYVPNNEAALALVNKRQFEVVLTSEKTDADKDLDLLRRIRRVHPHTRVIILAPPDAPSGVIAAIRENAFGYFTGPIELETLRYTLYSALEAPAWDDGIELRSATPTWIRLIARCERATADRLVQFVNEISDELRLEDRRELSTAFREMLLNAMEHGGNFDPNEYVEISYLRSMRAVSCRIQDPGKGFSLDQVPHSAISNPPGAPCAHMDHREAHGLRPGGFGILMARNFVDELIYNQQGNEVILIKHLDRGAAESVEE